MLDPTLGKVQGSLNESTLLNESVIKHVLLQLPLPCCWYMADGLGDLDICLASLCWQMPWQMSSASPGMMGFLQAVQELLIFLLSHHLYQ